MVFNYVFNFFPHLIHTGYGTVILNICTADYRLACLRPIRVPRKTQIRSGVWILKKMSYKLLFFLQYMCISCGVQMLSLDIYERILKRNILL